MNEKCTQGTAKSMVSEANAGQGERREESLDRQVPQANRGKFHRFEQLPIIMYRQIRSPIISVVSSISVMSSHSVAWTILGSND